MRGVSGGSLYEMIQVPGDDGHLAHHAVLALQQLERRAEFGHRAGVHDNDLVVVHNGVEAMRDSNNRTVGKTGSDNLR